MKNNRTYIQIVPSLIESLPNFWINSRGTLVSTDRYTIAFHMWPKSKKLDKLTQLGHDNNI